jgi:hypothetical protein
MPKKRENMRIEGRMSTCRASSDDWRQISELRDLSERRMQIDAPEARTCPIGMPYIAAARTPSRTGVDFIDMHS